MNDTILKVSNGREGPLVRRDSLPEEEPIAVERVRGAPEQSKERPPHAQAWFDTVSDSYLRTDLHGVVDEANHAASLLFGVREEFLLGKPLGLLMAEECHSTFYRHLARLNDCDNVEQWEGRIARPHGPAREVALTAAALAEEQGVKLHWTIRDISELRAAQRQALQAERLAAIGQMAAGLAHEGRNALQRIQACTAILNLRLQGRPEELDILARIQRAQDDLQHLFEDVRNYAIAPRLKRIWHDLRQSWREAWSELANLPQWGYAALCEDIDGIEPLGRVDPFYLKHVFRNLLENALSCGVNPVRVVIHCRPAMLPTEDAICLCLRDNGPGIPAESRARLFEPFYTTKTSGTGLGLAICKRIIEAHGGQIEARSHSEQGDESTGAEIVITLPRRGT